MPATLYGLDAIYLAIWLNQDVHNDCPLHPSPSMACAGYAGVLILPPVLIRGFSGMLPSPPCRLGFGGGLGGWSSVALTLQVLVIGKVGRRKRRSWHGEQQDF